AGNIAVLLGQEPHHGEHRHALAAAGFTDDAEGGAARNRQVDAIDGVSDTSGVAIEHHPEIFDFDERRRGHEALSAATALAISALTPARSVTPPGSRRLGRNLRKCIQCSRLPRWSRSSSASGST